MEHKSPRDSELTAAGWTRQFSASQPRLNEAVTQYEELGFEVLLEPVNIDPDWGVCSSCPAENPDYIKMIYTRPAEDQGELEEECTN